MRWTHLTLIALLPLLAACGSDEVIDPDFSNGGGEGTGSGSEIDGVNVEHTDPVAAFDALGQAMEAKSPGAYAALLTDDFTFHLRDDDAGSFPWLAEDFWDRATELSFMNNMFDPSFSGENPPVDSFDVACNVLGAPMPNGDGDQVITADCTITVFTGPSDGFRSDTRFILTLQSDDDGHYRIRVMQEIEKLRVGGDAGLSVEDSSWGAVKSLYR